MSLLKPREKRTPKPGRTQDNLFGHRLTMFWDLDQATCAYCGEVYSGIVLEIAAGAVDEAASPIKGCRVAAKVGV